MQWIGIMHSPELETLDLLSGENLPLGVVRQIFPDNDHFCRALLAMLSAGDVRLFDEQGQDVAAWKWKQMFSNTTEIASRDRLTLELTAQGARRIL